MMILQALAEQPNHPPDRAVRVLMSDTEHGYGDGFLGPVDGNFAAQLGDFIVKRRDGLISYNWLQQWTTATRSARYCAARTCYRLPPRNAI